MRYAYGIGNSSLSNPACKVECKAQGGRSVMPCTTEAAAVGQGRRKVGEMGRICRLHALARDVASLHIAFTALPSSLFPRMRAADDADDADKPDDADDPAASPCTSLETPADPGLPAGLPR